MDLLLFQMKLLTYKCGLLWPIIFPLLRGKMRLAAFLAKNSEFLIAGSDTSWPKTSKTNQPPPKLLFFSKFLKQNATNSKRTLRTHLLPAVWTFSLFAFSNKLSKFDLVSYKYTRTQLFIVQLLFY